MTDDEVLKAVCCLAGAGGDVMLEELQMLRKLADRHGIANNVFDASTRKMAEDEDYRARQMDIITDDVDRSMNALINAARDDGTLDEGHVTMLLWRVATKLGLNAEHFEKLLAAAHA